MSALVQVSGQCKLQNYPSSINNSRSKRKRPNSLLTHKSYREMAEQFPHATVVGTDLSAIQPLMIPPNCRFEVDDACLEWTYPANSFDYIHVRELFGCIADWDFFFAEAFNCVRPGGWIEVVEHSVEPISDDGSVDEQHFYTEWGKTVMHMGELTGKPFGIWRDSRQKLEKAGFVDIVEVTYKWPMNGWSADHKLHEIGRWNQVRLHHGVEGFMLRLLTAVGGVSFLDLWFLIVAKERWISRLTKYLLVVHGCCAGVSFTDAKRAERLQNSRLSTWVRTIFLTLGVGLLLNSYS